MLLESIENSRGGLSYGQVHQLKCLVYRNNFDLIYEFGWLLDDSCADSYSKDIDWRLSSETFSGTYQSHNDLYRITSYQQLESVVDRLLVWAFLHHRRLQRFPLRDDVVVHVVMRQHGVLELILQTHKTLQGLIELGSEVGVKIPWRYCWANNMRRVKFCSVILDSKESFRISNKWHKKSRAGSKRLIFVWF